MTGLMSGLPALITSGLGWHIPEFSWMRSRQQSSVRVIRCAGGCCCAMCYWENAFIFAVCFWDVLSSAVPPPAHARGFVMVWVVRPHAVTQKTPYLSRGVRTGAAG